MKTDENNDKVKDLTNDQNGRECVNAPFAMNKLILNAVYSGPTQNDCAEK